MDWNLWAYFTLLLFLFFVPESKAWSGHVCSRWAVRYEWSQYCICLYGWGCSLWRERWVRVDYTQEYCCPGWTHNGNEVCTIPICYPACKNGGRCTNPNVCQCIGAYTGSTCDTPQCSYLYPCFPGDCTYPQNCNCTPVFGGSQADGCKDIVAEKERPELGKVTAILANYKRIANAPDRLLFEFVTDATLMDETVTVWSNQNPFNLLSFNFESHYMTPDGIPKDRPLYVHDFMVGIVAASIHVNLTKIPRNKASLVRDVHFDKTYNCTSFSYLSPVADKSANCTIVDNQFATLIEHGDWLTITFVAKNGGYRKRINTDTSQFILPPDRVFGKVDRRTVEFRFDYEVPVHCSELNGTQCSDPPLHIANDITRNTIRISWNGWFDKLVGMWQYYIEIFKLSPDPYGRLIEMEPLKPLYTQTIDENEPHRVQYKPIEPGMYSILLHARDMANNSKIARRLCLYDPVSTLEMDTTGKYNLHVATAASDTGFVWQSSTATITVTWNGHFFNRIHRDSKLLEKVMDYPTQFATIKDDGILNVLKYVYPGLDDNDGNRTIKEITNFNGIVRFEVNEDFQDGNAVPSANWKELSPLAENYTFSASLVDGRKIKVWVRAHDIMGFSAYNYTEVKIDSSPPKLTAVTFQKNFQNGSYKYSSRFVFSASDQHSGVHTIEFRLIMDDTGEVKYAGKKLANFDKDPSLCSKDPECLCVEEICFKDEQVLDIDNCWFLTKAEVLKRANMTIQVVVYNQAWLSKEFSQQVTQLNKLDGLTDTSGPTNIKTSNEQSNGVRLNWNLPDSCYGQTDILIQVVETNTTYRVTKESSFIDILGLDEEKTYNVRFSMTYQGEDLGIVVPFSFKTGTTDNSALIGGVVGGVLGFLLIIAILIGIITILLRRGRAPQPIQKKYNQYSVRRRERKSMALMNRSCSGDNRRMSELYLYGGMTFESKQEWHLSRDDITFESLIKQGNFANIYKATMHHRSKTQDHVVAKTLKDTHTDNDVQLMKAKINFLGTKVGNHPNVLKFVGAVLSDDTIGPFIVHEYCENGTLKEYLEKNKNNVTVELQEMLFRFGLDIAKGMEFLAQKDIVHRRLAARNILLNFLNAVKITGFGPQPIESTDTGDAEAGRSGKKERIPIKWMAPECMESTVGATQKSDVWSYGIVLWEIFSLGDTPYSNIRSGDLPDRLKKGERLPKPEQCDDTWYKVMKKIWSYDRKKRPSFTEIRNELDQMFITSGNDSYYYSR